MGSCITDTYRSKSEINKDDEAWTLTARLDSSKGTKVEEQKNETPWKCQAEPAEDSKSETTISYNAKRDKKSNSPTTEDNFVQRTNIETKRTFRLKKDFLTKIIILSLAI